MIENVIFLISIMLFAHAQLTNPHDSYKYIPNYDGTVLRKQEQQQKRGLLLS